MEGIYNCKTETGEIAYVGSSGVSLEKLEWNHRNYFKFSNSYESAFRKNLREEGEDWTFEWAVEPLECSKKVIEAVERAFIKLQNPLFNVDRDPVKSSIKYGRY